ncbi:hypothetical protein PPERSA_09350 [Pseudocohnilembus persalinus]|uniref:Band 7 domain-containing protein n=1 Tax=Pseudocohnilembus persalinus TaxID=266149 RepID=A0A0V0QYN4_PSEPJ|nr:hypothetical protein PPERSA_09350 [Pseudocohnilembus persalinus]|eukprot:KRX07136.1 hypothetical protein PPERSA_09350 [Pseudocohnilembus persalinus]
MNQNNPDNLNKNYSFSPNQQQFNQHQNQQMNNPNQQKQQKDELLTQLTNTAIKIGVPLLLGAGALLFISKSYKISRANEYIVKTGMFINDLVVSKKTFKLPLQEIAYVDMTPKSYQFVLHSMSKEKMEFILPCVFTIGPKDDYEQIKKFAKYLLFEEESKVQEIIRGMVEGETRVLAANMSIEDIFKGRTEFKQEIINNVQHELEKLGLFVVNANIKELQDSKDSRYFSYLSQKVSADAENQAKIDISEARKIGEIGEKLRQGEQRQRVIEIESQTQVYENQKQQDIANSQTELEKKKAEFRQITNIANIESEKNAERRQEEMQMEVEKFRQLREIEKLRATQFSEAKVQAEISQENAKGQAQAIKQIADAEMYKEQRKADAVLYSKQKEAEGINAIYEAQAQGLSELLKSFNYDTKAALSFMMIEKDIYQKLAEQNAKAIQGLNPKISIWNTGESNNNTYDSISGLMKSIPPIVETLQEQTDIKFPDWMLKSNSEQKQMWESLNEEQKNKMAKQFFDKKEQLQQKQKNDQQ